MDGTSLIDLTYALRIFLNVYLYVMLVFFYNSFLVPRERYHPAAASALLLLLLLAGSVLMLLLYSHYLLKIFLLIVWNVLSLHLLYRGSLSRKVILSAFYIVLIMLSEALISAFAALWLGVSMPMIADEPDLISRLFPLAILSYTLCYGLPAVVARLRPKNEATPSLSRFLILPLSQLLMMGGFLYSFFLSDRPFGASDAAITLIMVAACIAVDIIFVFVIRDLVQKQRLEEQQSLQARHYAALMAQQSSIRALRHDLANHLMTVNVLAQKDAAQADSYIRELTHSFKEMTAIDFCENKTADAVLYSKHAEASAAGIDLLVDAALPENPGIDGLDLMSLLSNLIDNALDAAKGNEAGYVSVSLRQDAGTVFLKVENPIRPGEQLNTRQTSKANKHLHGQGLRIAEDICKKYHGSLSVRQQDNLVCAEALLIPQ